MTDNFGLFNRGKNKDKKEDRNSKRKDRRDHRIEKIKVLTDKAVAVAQKRKWLVFLVGIGLAAYFVISTGGFSTILQLLKFKR